MFQETPVRGRFSFALAGYLGACILLVLGWLSTAHFPPWVSWHGEVATFAAVVLVAWTALGGALKSRAATRIDIPVASLPFLAFLAFVSIQRATGVIHYDGDVWLALFYVTLCVSCLAIGAAAGGAGRLPGSAANLTASCKLLASCILTAGVLSTIVACAQVFSLWETSAWIVRMTDLRRPGANLAQPNQLATLLVMGAASVIFLETHLGRVLRLLLMLTMCAGVAITESRGGALALLALFAWWLFGAKYLTDRSSRWQIVGCALAFVVMYLAWPHILNNTHALGYEILQRDAQEGRRFAVWQQLLEGARLHPWTGWGFHRGPAAHNSVLEMLGERYTISEPYSYSHNVMLDLLIWFGTPIAVLMSAAAALYLWLRFRGARSAPAWYGLAVTLPLLVHSMVEYPFAYAYLLAPPLFLLGATEATTGSRPLLRIPVRLAAALFALLTCAMAWSVLEYMRAEEDFRIARFESMRIGSTPTGYVPPKLRMFDQLQLLVDVARITPTRNMSAHDIQIVRDAALYYPWLATQSRYALTLALNGDPVAAARQMNVVRAMWGDKIYGEIKQKIAELAATEYPELQQLSLP